MPQYLLTEITIVGEIIQHPFLKCMVFFTHFFKRYYFDVILNWYKNFSWFQLWRASFYIQTAGRSSIVERKFLHKSFRWHTFGKSIYISLLGGFTKNLRIYPHIPDLDNASEGIRKEKQGVLVYTKALFIFYFTLFSSCIFPYQFYMFSFLQKIITLSIAIACKATRRWTDIITITVV